MKLWKTIASLIFAATVSAEAGKVVCIGINDYNSYPDLKHAEKDATEMARAFELLGHTVTVLTCEAATAAAVKAAFAEKPDIIYFAGHAEAGRLMAQDGEVTLAEVAAPETLLLLDCCYVGGGLKTAGTMKTLAAAEYEAFESDGHGLFTKYLLTWLGDGKTLQSQDLTPYLERHLRAETGGWQKPVLGFI